MGLLCEPWGTLGRVGVVSMGADAPKEISVEKEKNDLKSLREVVTLLVEQEFQNFKFLNDCASYFSNKVIIDLEHYYSGLVEKLYEAYFGDVGKDLFEYWQEIIVNCYMDELSIEETVNNIIGYNLPKEIEQLWRGCSSKVKVKRKIIESQGKQQKQ